MLNKSDTLNYFATVFGVSRSMKCADSYLLFIVIMLLPVLHQWNFNTVKMLGNCFNRYKTPSTSYIHPPNDLETSIVRLKWNHLSKYHSKLATKWHISFRKKKRNKVSTKLTVEKKLNEFSACHLHWIHRKWYGCIHASLSQSNSLY